MRSRRDAEIMSRVAALLGVLELAREQTEAQALELRRRVAELEETRDRQVEAIVAWENTPAADRQGPEPEDGSNTPRLIVATLGDLEGATAYLSVLRLQIEQIEAVRGVQAAATALRDLVEQADEVRETASPRYRDALIEAQTTLAAAMDCDDPSTALSLCDQALERTRVALAQRRDLGISDRSRSTQQIGLFGA